MTRGRGWGRGHGRGLALFMWAALGLGACAGGPEPSLPSAASLADRARGLGCVLLDSGLPGKTLLVIGGSHGDEASGPQAAMLLEAGGAPKRGRLLVLAEANPAALALASRAGPDGLDLNRLYPGRPSAVGGGPGEALRARAAAILGLALEADLVVDLHEEGRAWTEADLPTLVFSPPASALVLDLVEALATEGQPFAFTGGSPEGSLVAELGKRARPALTVEVPARLSLGERASLHLGVIAAIEGLLGMD